VTVDSTKQIMKSIGNKFPDMSEQEIEIEYLVQLWLAASDEHVTITRDEHNKYFFTGRNNPLPDNSEVTSCDEFYSRVLASILVESIKRGYVYVVDISGEGDYGFLNAHEVGIDNFFLHTMPRDEAIEFAISLIDDSDSI
jgi:hypothetical protein